MTIIYNFFKNTCNKNIFLTLYFFVILFPVLDFFRNKFYYQIWDKKTISEKFLLLFYLISHNIIYFFAYIFPFLLLINESCSKIYYLLYIFFSGIVLISWEIYDDYCILTLKQNELLEIDKDYKFRTPYDIIFNIHGKISELTQFSNHSYYYYLYITIIIFTILSLI